MALPQDGVNMNELPKTSTIPTGKELLFIDPTTNEGGVITLEDFTKQILQNLTSQTFALDQGTKTLPAALNELNSKTEISKYYNDDLLIYAESLTTGRYFFNTTDKTKNSPCSYGFCIIYIVDGDRKIIIYDKTTNSMYANTKMNSGTAWIGWRKI